MNVKKRSGKIVDFDGEKIYKAINEANERVKNKYKLTKTKIREISNQVISDYENLGSTKSVEYIQDKVEEALVEAGAYGVAKEYITYRYKRDVARSFGKDFIEEISKKLKASDVQNQNANVDEHSFGGRIGEASDVMTKKYALDYLISPMAKANHENNEIYIHDLSAYAVGMHNCLSIPFDDLLAKGFNTRQTDVRPAGSVNTAMQLVAVIFQLQSLQQFGGVSATHLDWTMVPYVRMSFLKHFNKYREFVSELPFIQKRPAIELDNVKEFSISKYKEFGHKHIIDKLIYKFALRDTRKEIHQAVEGLYHNLNTLQSRSGNQLPFTSINYGTCTLEEGRMVTKELLTVSIEGLGKLHKTSIFPCGIFQYMKGVNDKKRTPNYDLYRLALKSTSKRLYPNYANVDWSGNAGYDRNDPRTYFSTINKTVA